MTMTMTTATTQYHYTDYGLWWERELRDWVPERILDAHVHLGPPEAMAPIRGERVGVPLTSYTSLTWSELEPFYRDLYSGKTVDGLIAFGFPFQETDLEVANRYIADLICECPQITGFIVADPLDVPRTIAQFETAKRRGVRFRGVKPYYDLLLRNLTNSVQVSDTAEFVPDELLAWMNRESLSMMLHTCSIGMGDIRCQRWVLRTVEKYPNVKIILAHMGRYFEQEQFFSFFDSGLMDHPSLFLETSDAMAPDVYRRMFTRPDWCERLVFGSDLPYGLFNSGDRTDAHSPSPAYNTYHVINAIKVALENSALSLSQRQQIKSDIFFNNATERLLA